MMLCPTASPLLNVSDLHIQLDGATRVRGLHLQLLPGERVCLLGPSGSGKSLTARALLGALPAGARVSGSIRLCGVEVSQRPLAQRSPAARPAAIFQDAAAALNPLMPVGRQLALAAQRRDAPDSLIAALGLQDIPALRQRYPGELSGGQRQRICIALALLGGAPLLIADEPTSALDVVAQQQVAMLLAERAPTLLFITHDIALASRLCQRALVLMDGEVVEQGSLNQLLSAPQHAWTRQLVTAARRASAARPVSPIARAG